MLGIKTPLNRIATHLGALHPFPEMPPIEFKDDVALHIVTLIAINLPTRVGFEADSAILDAY